MKRLLQPELNRYNRNNFRTTLCQFSAICFLLESQVNEYFLQLQNISQKSSRRERHKSEPRLGLKKSENHTDRIEKTRNVTIIVPFIHF